MGTDVHRPRSDQEKSTLRGLYIQTSRLALSALANKTQRVAKPSLSTYRAMGKESRQYFAWIPRKDYLPYPCIDWSAMV